ncbi:MAG: transcription termination/antitermination factor NusG [Candidatus Omnitrophica bacterium]|nr:transcription termination/antitermination factor NusG [Candidatus Omnitrophota bacterium]
MSESKWYVVHTLTGQEEKVKLSLESRAREDGDGSLIQQVLIPTEQVSEVRDRKRRISLRKFFPGYVLVEMSLNDESWYVVKNTPGVTGFVGSGSKPVPLSDREVNVILKQAEEKKEKPVPKVIFEVGESVKVIEGPFTNFTGEVQDVSPDKGRLKVMVSIFGRETPVELEYWQVEKM